MKQRHSGLPFDDFRELINSLPAGNDDIALHTREQLQSIDDKCSEICVWYSRWSGRSPVIHRPLMTLFAGTHQVQDKLDEGAQAQWLLEQVTHVAEGAATVNRLCQQQDMGLKLFDLALQLPVADISLEPALDEKSCAGTIAFGMEAIAGGSDLLSICAIEQAESISALAILTVLNDLDIQDMADKATQQAVIQAVDLAKSHASNPLEVLRRLGGRETAAFCGAILAARTEHIPTVIGGVTALAAASVLHAQNPDAVSHCVFAQKFKDESLNACVEKLGLSVIFNVPVSQAFGADASMAVGFVKSACKHFHAGQGE